MIDLSRLGREHLGDLAGVAPSLCLPPPISVLGACPDPVGASQRYIFLFLVSFLFAFQL
jgi:hypothetical protein